MYLAIDNYDSFTHNLVSLMRENGCEVAVTANDRLDMSRLEGVLTSGDLEGIVISPGPKSPAESGLCLDALARCAGRVPILGVCLGHQIIAYAYGASVAKGVRPMHGVVSSLRHDGTGLFEGLPSPFAVTRYHSLVVREEGLPQTLRINARTEDGAVMAISHASLPIYGVQFHPEAVLSQHGNALIRNFMRICVRHAAQRRNETHERMDTSDVFRAPWTKNARTRTTPHAHGLNADVPTVGAERQTCVAHAAAHATHPSSTIIRKIPRTASCAAVFDLVHDEAAAAFLDSCDRKRERFSIIGLDPYLTLEDVRGVCLRDKTPCGEPFLAALRRALENAKSTCHAHDYDLPLVDGAIGYLSYDFGRRMTFATEPCDGAANAMADARMVFYDRLIIEDKHRDAFFLIAHGRNTPAEQSIAELIELVECATARRPHGGGRTAQEPCDAAMAAPTSPFDRASYGAAIERIVDYAKQGHVYVMNMTRRIDVQSAVHPYAVYRRLRSSNPAPFSAYFNYEDARIACSSPERFLRVRADRTVETRPIKGTRRRGATPEEDARLALELEQSTKDRSELLMVVDLERNDLNRVCAPGSVQVPSLFEVEPHPAVFQLCSTVTGKIASENDAIDLIAASFPGGSITGAPKKRAMEIIDELERGTRGLYTGSIGYMASDGSCDLNIVIRTAVEHDGTYSIGTGGGITHESQPDFEYDETELKADALIRAIAEASEDARLANAAPAV